MLGVFRVADGPAVPRGGIVFDGGTWYVSQYDESGVDLAANLSRMVAGAVVTVETPTGSSTLTITGAARAEGDHVVIVGDRVREGAMPAGQETGLWLRTSLVPPPPPPSNPLRNADIFGPDGPPLSITTVDQLKADAVFGDTGTGNPYNGGTGTFPRFGVDERVNLGAGVYAWWDGTAWQPGWGLAP